VLSSREIRQEMGEAGRARVEQHFTSVKMAGAMLQVYQETLSESYRPVESTEELETQVNEVY
jgi:glycosyltransferase involved in cell wall biosynthesis